MNKKIKQMFIVKFHHSKIMRIILYPINRLYRLMLLKKYSLTDDSKYIKKLKNIHSGQRCFIIGNGPSLIPKDLECLENEICFASNRIYNIYPYTSWRPTYYISIDTGFLDIEIEDIKKSGTYLKFLNYKSAILGRDNEDNIVYICTYGKFRINPFLPEADTLNDDVSKYVTKVHTVTATAIEIAIYMGFNKIYLLGVDNNYALKVDKNGRIYKDPSVERSYFKGMKDCTGKEGPESSFQNVGAMNNSYLLCKKFAEQKGVKIYNATRGGKLEIFERIKFDKLLEK